MSVGGPPKLAVPGTSRERALSEGGVVAMPLQPMFWGAHWASFQDRFGIHWMINAKG